MGAVVVEAKRCVLHGRGEVGVELDEVRREAVRIVGHGGKRCGLADQRAGLLMEPVPEPTLAAEGESQIGGLGGIIFDAEARDRDAQVGVAFRDGDHAAAKGFGFFG